MGKYDPLRDYLSKCDGTDVLLTFSKMDSILSPNRLPQGAYDYSGWWSNNKANEQAAAWMGAGWSVTTANLLHREVSFTKRG
jgi:hypothetical protein